MGRVRRWSGAAVALAFGALMTVAPTAAAAPAAELPNDPGAVSQWGLSSIRAPEAWAISRGAGITVAVIDSGVDLNHEDLREDNTHESQIVGAASCRNGTCADGGGTDDYGHGTHVAGIIAATADNGLGVAGVAPDAKVLAIKVLYKPSGCASCEATGSAEDVTAAIDYAIARGAQVINLSLGSTIQSVLGPSFADAIKRAWAAGVIAVVAAGNDFILGSGFSNEPAIVVSALNRAGAKAQPYSNGVGAAMWGLAAPGGESDDSASCQTSPNGILSTYWSVDNDRDNYACIAGTSMAAPHVAGAVAILRSAGVSPQETVDRLLSSARDIAPAGPDSTFGSGGLDIAAAVDGLTPTGSGPGVSTTPTTDEVPAPPPTTAATSLPPATQPSSTVTTAPPPTSEAPQVTLPRAATVEVNPGNSGSNLPGAWVTAAVALTLAVGSAAGWYLLRGADWARRTPR
jgi:subtilisin family serine protease